MVSGRTGPGNEPRADLDMTTIPTKLATFEILQHGLVLQVEQRERPNPGDLSNSAWCGPENL